MKIDMSENGYITNEELELYKRLVQGQHNDMVVHMQKIEEKLKKVAPQRVLAQPTKDLLDKQVEKMFQQIKFLNSKIVELEKQLKNR